MALNLKALQDAFDKSSGSTSSSSNNIKWMKLKKGVTYAHILPPWNDGDLPFHDAWLHFVDDESSNVHVFQCAKRFENGRCVLCDRVAQLLHSDKEEEEKLGKRLKASHRHFYNVCGIDNEVQVLGVGPKAHKEILFELKEDMSAGFDPTAYKGGVMIKIERTDQGSWNTTDYKARAERSRIDLPDVVAANHSNLPKLDKIYEIYTNDELLQVLSGNLDPKGIKTKKVHQTSADTSKNVSTQTIVEPQATNIVNQVTAVTVQPTATLSPVSSPNVSAIQINRKPSLEEARRILAGG